MELRDERKVVTALFADLVGSLGLFMLALPGYPDPEYYLRLP
jgi:hypothetical protein